ncbi:hypothetical protein NW768_000052 [Fusarium equiseti]|uniref:Uncharacterized protein n=1 Tax=Fusarium equiseti TaxID=61235 RepID=A0ABQ8RRF4_FUSEQ|nr:hypothetical protein NW768_000052 [Fusarium equiseti]
MRPLPEPEWMPPRYFSKIPSIITSIRQLPEGATPTLESIPQIEDFMTEDEPLSGLIRDMQRTDFKRWGFVIFRTVYSEESQSQWDTYIEFLKASVEMDLESLELSTLLKPHLEWTIIEDRDTLDNASKQHVREKFSEWASQRSVQRDGPRVEEAFQYGLPRFRYCIYVDQKCLDTVNQYKAWADAGGPGSPEHVVYVILDKRCKPEGQGKGGFPRIEGCSREYTGWQYAGVDAIADVYNTLSIKDLSEDDYVRPPHIFPGDRAMPD